MENPATKESSNLDMDLVDSDVEEKISDPFICCVCLDLLYKPVVLACGHVSCFWCVHKSMNGVVESSCPLCRHRYVHFPSVCVTFHFLIVKMYPNAYRRRDKQIFEEEQRQGYFSPQINEKFSVLNCQKESSNIGRSESSSSPSYALNLSLVSGSTCEGKDFQKSGYPKSGNNLQDGGKTIGIEENKPSQANIDGTSLQVSINDVLCPACKELLFRPAVLNCGHAYCEICVVSIAEDDKLVCRVCESLHPSDSPKVCLELNKILEETFSKEYALQLKRHSVEHKLLQSQQKYPPSCSRKSTERGAELSVSHTGELPPQLSEHGAELHIGVGCDSCGMCPIVGSRYRCKDCKEKIGFDLCGECYNTRSKLPGRFNQCHTADHSFEHIKRHFSSARLMLNIPTGLVRLVEYSDGDNENSDDEGNILLIEFPNADTEPSNAANHDFAVEDQNSHTEPNS